MAVGRTALAAASAALFLWAGPASAQTDTPCHSETVVPAGQDGLRADCHALWDFYLQLEDRGKLDDVGPGQWGPNSALSSWRGVAVGAASGRVTDLNLPRSGLSGRISGELGRLTELNSLDLAYNSLSGSIPSGLGKLSNLSWLGLDNNNLSGDIPNELGRLTNLTTLHLNNNNLSGPVPSELSRLAKLDELNIYIGNRLEGRLPPELSRFDPYQSDPLGLIAYAEAHREFTLSDEVWDVWLCDTPNGRLDLGLNNTVVSLNREVAPYFRWLSNDRYRPRFRYAGGIKGADGPGCLEAAMAERAAASSDNRVLVIQDIEDYIGVTVGEFQAAKIVVTSGPGLLGLVVHEIGHALGFPHSYGGLTPTDAGPFEYDNPMDVMSGALGLDIGTIAVNRYAAGWMDAVNVAVHPVGNAFTYELRPTGAGGVQMLVLTSPQIGVMTTLEARVARGYDSGIVKQGVEVYRVDQRGCPHPTRSNACWADDRRTQPFPPTRFDGPPAEGELGRNAARHVHSVGDSFRVGSATVEVLERTGDNFMVRVSDAAVRAFSGRFSDDEASVHEVSIETIAALGITVGCSPTRPDRFCPDRMVTRAQMMAFLARALGEGASSAPKTNRFTDVPDGAWYRPYVERLADLGVVEPYPDGTFRPFEPLTRRDMAVLVTRAFPHISPAAAPVGTFADVAAGAPHAAEVEAVLAAGVTRGCSAAPLLYCPSDPVTRAQMASFLVRALQGASTDG